MTRRKCRTCQEMVEPSSLYKYSYCREHRCFVKGCNERPNNYVNDGDEKHDLCYRHRCLIHDSHKVCSSERSGPGEIATENKKCPDYHCLIEDCYNRRLENHRYCEVHYYHLNALTHRETLNKDVLGCTHKTENGTFCGNPRLYLGNDRYHEYCQDCSKYCEIESCMNLHFKGSPRCAYHSCRCFGGNNMREYCDHKTIQLKKMNWRCYAPDCRVCKVTGKFLACYLGFLGCDTPILEAVMLIYL